MTGPPRQVGWSQRSIDVKIAEPIRREERRELKRCHVRIGPLYPHQPWNSLKDGINRKTECIGDGILLVDPLPTLCPCRTSSLGGRSATSAGRYEVRHIFICPLLSNPATKIATSTEIDLHRVDKTETEREGEQTPKRGEQNQTLPL